MIPSGRLAPSRGGVSLRFGRVPLEPARAVIDESSWENLCGFVAFDVDPGVPGGLTSITATYYAVNGVFSAAVPVDKFTLTRPRRDTPV